MLIDYFCVVFALVTIALFYTLNKIRLLSLLNASKPMRMTALSRLTVMLSSIAQMSNVPYMSLFEAGL